MPDPDHDRPPQLDPSAVRAIVFDLDGTLIDSYEAIAESLNHARRHYGLPPLDVDEIRGSVGRGLESLVAQLVGADRVGQGVRKFRERYARVYAERTFALPGVPRTLRLLHERGYALAVASNKPAYFSTRILDRLHLRRFMSCVAGPDTAGSAKPDPEMIGQCLERMGVEPARAVYVGDMVLDVESAARAGVPVVLVPGGSSAEEELRRTGESLLGSFAELARIFTGPSTGEPGRPPGA